MVKSFKKGLAMVLAVAMAFATPIAVKQADVVKAEESADSSVYKVTGSAWWNASNGVASWDADSTVAEKFYVDANGALTLYAYCSDGAGTDPHFHIDVTDTTREAEGHWMTCSSWLDTFGLTVTRNGEPAEINHALLKADHMYKLDITGIGTASGKAVFTDVTDSEKTEEIGTFTTDTSEFAVANTSVVFYSHFGTFFVGTDEAEVKKASTNIIENSSAKVSSNRKGIDISIDKVMDYDSLTVTPVKDGTDLDAIPLTTGEGGNATSEEVKEDKEDPEKVTATRITFNYVPKEAGAYTFKIAGKKGDVTDTEEISDTIKIASIAEDGTVALDAEIFAGLNVAPADYSVSWTEKIEGATYTGTVSKGTTKVADIAKNGDKIDVSKLENGKEYTVSVTAKLAGYKDQTLTKTFKYEKVEASANAIAVTKSTIGNTDFSTSFLGDWSQDIEIKDGKKYTVKFENHHGTTATANWNNFSVAFVNDTTEMKKDAKDRTATYVEYYLMRSDAFGWGAATYGAFNDITADGSIVEYKVTGSWDDFEAIMKDADVTMTVVRSGNYATWEYTAVSKSDSTKTFGVSTTLSLNKAKGDTAVNKAYMVLSVDQSYINMKSIEEADAGNTTIDKPKEGDLPVVTEKTAAISFMDGPTVSSNRKKITAEFSIKPDKVTATGSPKSVKISGKKVTITYKKALKLGKKIKVTAYKGTSSKFKYVTVKGTIKLSKVKAKKNTKKVTGKLNIKKATVKVKVKYKGKKKYTDYKKAKVNGKKFTFKTKKLKKGSKVVIKVTKKNYKTKTKTVKVK